MQFLILTFTLYFLLIMTQKKLLLLLWLMVLFCLPKHTSAQNETIETIGDVILVALPTTALGTTLIKEDYKGTLQLFGGMFTNVAITHGLKVTVNKPRPDRSDNRSFPSGHTSISFQGASFIQKRYGWKLGIPAYALAGFAGYSRIQANKHDGWDVLAGAIIGIGSTYIFTTPYQKEHMELSFQSGKGQYLLGLVYKL